MSPPSPSIWVIAFGSGANFRSMFFVAFLITPFSRLTSSSSPVAILSVSHSMAGRPIFIAFLKNILANDFAITQETPDNFMMAGACSLDEPSPKFLPPITKSPFPTFEANCGSASSRTCFANSLRSDLRWKYLPGAIRSVDISSPNFHAFPRKTIIGTPWGRLSRP